MVGQTAPAPNRLTAFDLVGAAIWLVGFAFEAVGDLGFFGMRYPEEAGGTGHDVVTYCLAVEELARGSLSVAAACTMQSLMGTYFLYRSGDEEILVRAHDAGRLLHRGRGNLRYLRGVRHQHVVHGSDPDRGRHADHRRG